MMKPSATPAPIANNTFAALRHEEKQRRRKEKNERQDEACEVSEKPADVSLRPFGGLMSKGMIWADVAVEDDDDEDDDDFFFAASERRGHRGGPKAQREMVSNDEDTSESSNETESSDEDDFVESSNVGETQLSGIENKAPSPIQSKSESLATKNLSKKELKQKEREEMKAALAEFGMLQSDGKADPVEIEDSAAGHDSGAAAALVKKKKKAKKRAATSKSGGEAEDTGSSNQPVVESVPDEGADVTSSALSRDEAVNLLRALQQQQGKKQGAPKSVVAAQATGKTEAKKRAETKKIKPRKNERHQPYQR